MNPNLNFINLKKSSLPLNCKDWRAPVTVTYNLFLLPGVSNSMHKHNYIFLSFFAFEIFLTLTVKINENGI